jgi:tetratricopeptide (TPR) repeat protein
VVYQPTIYSDTTEVTEQPITRTVYSPSTTVVSRPVVTKRVVVEEIPTATRTTTVQDTTQIILTPYQAALEAIKDKKPGEAVDQLNAHIAANPGDLRAARILAIMLTEQKNTSEAVRVVIDAYKRDPSLARQPIDAAELNIGSGRLRDITNEAERYAAKLRTGSSYLTVAMLMQAEGRHEDALAMVARASDAGLDQGIASTLEAALR